MTSDYLISGQHNIPIAVIPLKQFMQKLPVGFYTGGNRKMHHDPSKINLFLDNDDGEIFEHAYHKVLKVKTNADYELVKQRLSTLPIFLNVKIKERYTEHYVVVKRTVITWLTAMAYINPRHPVIKAQLQKKFDECDKLIREGKKFSFEIRIGEILKSWYASCSNRMFASYYSYGTSICVTNFRQRCNMCYNPLVWCIPVTWVLGPPYLIYRAVKCDDVIAELSGIVTYMKEGPRIVVRRPVNPARQPERQMPPPYATGSQQTAPSNAVALQNQPQFSNEQNTTIQDDEPLITA